MHIFCNEQFYTDIMWGIIIQQVVWVEFLPDVRQADFIGQTTTSGSARLSMLHDLNIYVRCVRWWFTTHCVPDGGLTHHHRKPQLFQTRLTVHAATDILKTLKFEVTLGPRLFNLQ